MKAFCRVCCQQPLGETELLAVGGLFGVDEGSLDAFPSVSRQISERYVLDSVSNRSLQQWCDAPRTKKAFAQTPSDVGDEV